MRIIMAIFITLHGMVHLLYFGHSMRFFELKTGLIWPEGSWAFGRLLGNEASRNFASVSLILVAISLVLGGVGILINQAWGQPLVIGGAALSIMVYFLFWNGRMQNLDGQGMIGMLIDVIILLAVLVFRWTASK